MSRKHEGDLADTAAARDGYLARIKRPSLPSDKKLRWHSYSGIEMCHDLARMVRVQRTIDKDANFYSEVVTDTETGEIIYECTEPLSAHKGRGTAKRRSENDRS